VQNLENVPSPPGSDGLDFINRSHGIVADEGFSVLGLMSPGKPHLCSAWAHVGGTEEGGDDGRAALRLGCCPRGKG